MNIKALAALAAAAVMAASLSACGKKTGDKDKTSSKAESSAVEKDAESTVEEDSAAESSEAPTESKPEEEEEKLNYIGEKDAKKADYSVELTNGTEHEIIGFAINYGDGEYYTVWRFEPGGYDDWGYVTSGYGTEADYNVYDDREFAYSSFRWEVRNGNIYIYYDDPKWNNVRIDWRDYSISSSRFRGTMYDWEERIYNFDLANVGYWDWNRYRTRAATRGEVDDSTYVGENGSSVATGRFAKALKEMSNK